MRILGIDPGTIILGWGLLEIPDEAGGGARGPTPGRFRLLDCGVARAPRGRPLAERLAAIHLRLVAVLREGRPEQAAIEQAFYGKSVASALALGEGRGVALLACAAAGIPILELTPAEVKRAVVGSGAASKAQVARMVGALLGLPGPVAPPDAADALAVAIAAAHRLRFEQLRRPTGQPGGNR